MLSIVNDQIVHASVKKNSERMNVGVLSIVSNSIENEMIIKLTRIKSFTVFSYHVLICYR